MVTWKQPEKSWDLPSLSSRFRGEKTASKNKIKEPTGHKKKVDFMIPSHESTQQLHMAPLIESSQHYEVGTVTVPMVQMKKQEVTQPAQSPTENK